MKFRTFWKPSQWPLLMLAFWTFLPFCSRAQQTKVTVVPPTQVVIQRGASATVSLRTTILPGLHVNSDKPKDEFLIPLQLSWSSSVLHTGKVSYPAAEEVQVGSDRLSVFTGTFDLKTDFAAPANAEKGSVVMSGKLHYQACNDRMCFRPATVDVKVPVLIQ